MAWENLHDRPIAAQVIQVVMLLITGMLMAVMVFVAAIDLAYWVREWWARWKAARSRKKDPTTVHFAWYELARRKAAKRKRTHYATGKSKVDKDGTRISDPQQGKWQRRIPERSWETPERAAEDLQDEAAGRLIAYRQLLKEFLEGDDPNDIPMEEKSWFTRYGLPDGNGGTPHNLPKEGM